MVCPAPSLSTCAHRPQLIGTDVSSVLHSAYAKTCLFFQSHSPDSGLSTLQGGQLLLRARARIRLCSEETYSTFQSLLPPGTRHPGNATGRKRILIDGAYPQQGGAFEPSLPGVQGSGKSMQNTEYWTELWFPESPLLKVGKQRHVLFLSIVV